MIEIRRIRSADAHYPYCEDLLVRSFPENEYRPLGQWRELTDREERFHLNILTDNGSRIGLLSWWELEGFRYYEHFCIFPQYRNAGYGRKVLEKVLEAHNGPGILEVERPDTELAARRIGFYRRLGLELCPLPYFQPAYRPGGEEVPMFLMSWRFPHLDTEFERVSRIIRREVYGPSSRPAASVGPETKR